MKGFLLFVLFVFWTQDALSAEKSTAPSEHCENFTNCKSCGSESDIRNWIKNKEEMYGSNFFVIQLLKRIINNENTEKSKLDNGSFFENYGAYFLYTFLSSSYDQERVKVIKYLLNNGVHPYDRISPKTSLAQYAIIRNDRYVFQLMLSSGKLLDCKSELNILMGEATSRKNNYFIQALEVLL